MDAVSGPRWQNAAEQPLHVLDNCRITWGTVISRTSDAVEVSCQALVWDGRTLALSEPSARLLDVWADGYCAVPDVTVGDEVAVHWGRLCGRLQPDQLRVAGRQHATASCG